MIHADILGQRARLSPGRTAVVEVSSGRRMSYEEMDRRALRAARACREGLGLERGDRLGILSGNRLEFLDVFFSAAKSGVILVPLGTRLTAAELAAIAEDCGLSALIFDAEHADTARELGTMIDVGRMVALDPPSDDAELLWVDLVAAAEDDGPLPTPCEPEDPGRYANG